MYFSPWIDKSLSHKVNTESKYEGSHNHNGNVANDHGAGDKDPKGTDG